MKKIASRKKKEKQEKSKTSIQFNFLFKALTVGDSVFFMRSPGPQSMSSERNHLRVWPVRPQGTTNFCKFDIDWGPGDEDHHESSSKNG